MGNPPLWQADLHLHTRASDGAFPPAGVVESARDKGLNLIAITDHDTIAGLEEALDAGEKGGIRVLPAIELSAGRGQEIHILGYGLLHGDPALHAFLKTQLQRRQERMLKIVDRLSSLGFPLQPHEITSSDGQFMGRMNTADAMVSHGYVSSRKEAFDRFLNPGKPAYVIQQRMDVTEGIEALRRFGAVVVLAHPGRSGLDSVISALLPSWIEAGLDGIEAYHASHHEGQQRLYANLARQHGLLVTGGSDSHGRVDGAQIGDNIASWRTMQEDVDKLLQAIQTNQVKRRS